MILKKLRKLIFESIYGFELKNFLEEHIHLEHPSNLSHGDFSTNIAMVLSKEIGIKPRDIAYIIVDNLKKKVLLEIENIEVAGPGFINIKLSNLFFENTIKDIIEKGINFGDLDIWSEKTIVVEHSSPNLFKPFHIGHMMNNTVGEAVVRLCKISGARTMAISYPSDVSLGIGKAVWQLMEYGVESINKLETLGEKMAFLGKCYSDGTKAFENRPELEIRIREITKDIYEHRDTKSYHAYKIGRDLNLDYFKKMTSKLGSRFNDYIFESEAGILGKKIVMENTPRVFTESNNAIIFEPKEVDIKKDKSLHTRVFINKEGNPTYEAKDLGLLKLKFDRYKPDLSIFVTDLEQGPYFNVVSFAAGKINKEWKEKTVHMTHGRLRFQGIKISSRLGSVPLVSDIIDSVKESIYKKTKSGSRKMNDEKADIIAISAIKYTILRTQPGKNIDFNPDTSLSFEGDSGPYLQYTYVRCKSVLKNAFEKGLSVETIQPKEWEILDIERFLYRLPEIFESAFLNYSPQIITGYVTELARLFNSWYGNTKIINVKDINTEYKLALVEAVSIVIKKALWSLGIDVPEEM